MDQARQTRGHDQQYFGSDRVIPRRYPYLFILALGWLTLTGCVTTSAAPTQSASVLTAVSPDRLTVAEVVPVGDQYILRLDDQSILPLAALPTWLEFSPANDAVGLIVNGDLYRYDTATHTATRLYEGVATAEFSASGAEITYTILDVDF